ncbi:MULTISPECIES: dTMP kinase [unclassified Nonomuraea]|uniref:dTMP kinase n=1 Tax=unclassified Nonomuraea TaxID=2593643 RepID=UPI0013766659|nr:MULTISPECIES: dTMP kinase [unclassified Nonomuraea]NBE97467.1 dTMP kinase [Nonomuraea sp. K271]
MTRPTARDGLFVVVEGPHGVGKTTTTRRLADQLRATGARVLVTSEPSGTALGRLVRTGESGLTGRALALAVAADRCLHIDTEIAPALKAGLIVISDRYVQSSLVLQRLDGLEIDEVWQYNAHVPVPSLSCYLRHTAEELGRRLRQRTALSRLEREGSPARELALYEEAFDFLAARGWPQVSIDCRGFDPDQVAAELLRQVQGAYGTHDV